MYTSLKKSVSWYLYNRSKHCNMLIILNELPLQKELQDFREKSVLNKKSKKKIPHQNREYERYRHSIFHTMTKWSLQKQTLTTARNTQNTTCDKPHVWRVERCKIQKKKLYSIILYLYSIVLYLYSIFFNLYCIKLFMFYILYLYLCPIMASWNTDNGCY